MVMDSHLQKDSVQDITFQWQIQQKSCDYFNTHSKCTEHQWRRSHFIMPFVTNSQTNYIQGQGRGGKTLGIHLHLDF